MPGSWAPWREGRCSSASCAPLAAEMHCILGILGYQVAWGGGLRCAGGGADEAFVVGWARLGGQWCVYVCICTCVGGEGDRRVGRCESVYCLWWMVVVGVPGGM